MTKLILHIGLPKTATTTIQTWADTNRETLAERGVIYPVPRKTTGMPKHQELVGALLHGKYDPIDSLLREARDDATLFLSAEGLSGHLRVGEAHPERLKNLRERLAPFDITLFLMTRNHADWIRSYHQQSVRNPPNPEFNFATSDTVEEFGKTPRVQSLLDTDQLIARAKTGYGAANASVAQLEGDWAEQLCGLLGLDDMSDGLRNAPRRNEGLSLAATEFLRQANGMEPLDEARKKLVKLLGNPDEKPKWRVPSTVVNVISQLVAVTDDEQQLLKTLQNTLARIKADTLQKKRPHK